MAKRDSLPEMTGNDRLLGTQTGGPSNSRRVVAEDTITTMYKRAKKFEDDTVEEMSCEFEIGNEDIFFFFFCCGDHVLR